MKENVYNFDFKKLNNLLENGSKEDFNSFLLEWGLENINGNLGPKEDYKRLYKDAEEYWNKQSTVLKLKLNGSYGGILNPSMKFFDQRIGQSTTLSGRSITKHMSAKANELIDGNYDQNGISTIANDTDSWYGSLWPLIKKDVETHKLDWNKDKAIQVYDDITNVVNSTFAEYLNQTFNVPLERGTLIKAVREIVASTGYFVKKKRYALNYFDKKGKRYDSDGKEGKIKITGLDLKRADTPKFIKDFLLEIVTDLLHGKTEHDIIEKIRKFREDFIKRKPWEKGVPKSVNNVSKYMEEQDRFLADKLAGRNTQKGFTVPGHVRASWNWNQLRDMYKDYHSTKIVDGHKIVLCYLKEGNMYNMTSIAHPIDEVHLPDWFTSLPFDEDRMEQTVLNAKLKNLLGVLKWDLQKSTKEAEHFETFFNFE